jgi:hypothetical protein
VTTPPGSALGGVTVTASNGSSTFTTTTLSTGATGTYRLSGLPVPGTYTVTFSRPDLASQTQAISLPATGATDVKGVDVAMVANTASLSGVVSDEAGKGVSEVAVSLTSGATSYQVVSAAEPTAGAFAIGGIVPGTYNLSFTRRGGAPTSVIVHLSAGQHLVQDETLSPTASIYGYVVLSSTGQVVPSAQVTLYVSTQYPTVSTATTTTGSNGEFSFADVAAPQSYIVAVSYPTGSSPQETALVTTSLGVASPVCGANATGQLPSAASGTTGTSGSTTSTTIAPSTSTSTSTSTTNLPTTPSSASCNAASDPLKVSLP